LIEIGSKKDLEASMAQILPQEAKSQLGNWRWLLWICQRSCSLRTCSSHVFTNSEFYICYCFFEKNNIYSGNLLCILILKWYSMYLEQLKTDIKFHWKNSSFVDSGFVKTCDELVIEQRSSLTRRHGYGCAWFSNGEHG
jgi:hypothetical protein